MKRSLIFSIMLCYSSLAAANQVFFIDKDNVIEGKMALNALTRISVRDDRIKSVFCGEEISMEQDAETGSIYVRPKYEGQKGSSISITTESGLIQDLYLKITDSDKSEPITLISKESETTDQPEKEISHEQQVTNMVKNIEILKVNSGEENFINLEINGKKFKVFKSKEIRAGELVGVKILINNTNNTELVLNEQDFKTPDMIAILIKDRLIPSDHNGEVILVRRAK